MFRIQNDDVIEKSKAQARAKAAKGKAKSRRPVQLMEPSEEVDDAVLEDAVIKFSRQHLEFPGPWVLTVPQYVLTPTVEQRARGWFQTNSQHWLRNTDLLDEMVSQTQGDEHLLASMYAVGLASFSNYVHSYELMARARKGYVSALKLTNSALRSPTDAKKDSTLFAILILGIYETVAGTNAQSILAWTSHINGAAALVEYRGVEQFNSEAGQRMFYQVVSSLMITCLQRSIAMPQHIRDLRKAATRLIDPPTAIWRLSSAIIDFTVFRADVRECRLVGPRTIIERALEIDRCFIEISADPPPEWQYDIEHTDDDPQSVWNKTFHVYRQAWISPIWNGMRTCRIMLHETIRDQLFASASAMNPVYTDAEADAQETVSVSVCMEMGRDIMRSVPRPRSLADQDEPHSVIAGTHYAYLLWPLYLAGQMDVSSEKVKDWVVRRLQIMSDVEGIKQAGVIAGYLDRRDDFFDRKPDLLPWKGPRMGQEGSRDMMVVAGRSERPIEPPMMFVPNEIES